MGRKRREGGRKTGRKEGRGEGKQAAHKRDINIICSKIP